MKTHSPHHKIGKIIRWILGIFFLILGMLGLIFPILQGFLFLMLGALILAPQIPWLHRKIEDLKQKHPKLKKTYQKAEHYKQSIKNKITNFKNRKKST